MSRLEANIKAQMLDKTGWTKRHNAAIATPVNEEKPIVEMLKAWKDYARIYKSKFDSEVGDDGVLGPEWIAIGNAMIGLLNGATGRLDCGTLDHFIRQVALEHNAEIE